MPKDPFETACWCGASIADPRQVLAEAFTSTDIKTLRREIKQIISYAQADKLYKEHAPCDVLLDMKIVRSVLKATHALKNEKGSPVAVAANDIFDKSCYCSPGNKANPWSDFPRCLSQKEFCDPYRVFKKFLKTVATPMAAALGGNGNLRAELLRQRGGAAWTAVLLPAGKAVGGGAPGSCTGGASP